MGNIDFTVALKNLETFNNNISLKPEGFVEIEKILSSKREFLLRLLENPVLLSMHFLLNYSEQPFIWQKNWIARMASWHFHRVISIIFRVMPQEHIRCLSGSGLDI